MKCKALFSLKNKTNKTKQKNSVSSAAVVISALWVKRMDVTEW